MRAKRPYSVCLIGNSHVAAVKQAWTNRPPHVCEDFRVTFFSAQNRLMCNLELKGRCFISRHEELTEKLRFTSGGQTKIDIDAYDAFVLVGGGICIDIPRFFDLGFGTADQARLGPVENLVSRTCFEAILEAAFNQSQTIQTAKRISTLCDAPILVAAGPNLSERVLEEAQYKSDVRFHDATFLADVSAQGRRAAERVVARCGLEILWQDDATIGPPGFTKTIFGLNPVRFAMRGRAAPPFDRKHGNEDYGYLSLMKILGWLDMRSNGRVLAKALPTPAAAAR